MCSIIGPQWVTGELAFSRTEENTFHCRFYNGLSVSAAYCTSLRMHGEFAL